jgi:CHRD domain-containing protein
MIPTGRIPMTLKVIAAGAALALISVASASAAQNAGNSFHATLTGKVEVPKGDPDGKGTAEVKITGATVCWEIKASKVATLAAAHIHKGRPGVAGPVVVPFGKTFKAKGCVKSTSAIAAAIAKNPGAYYVNVHNAKYPAGALRGQLRSDG